MDKKLEFITIDGSQGEGGGQIFRTTLSLAMCLQKNVVIKNIRAGRRKSGLLRQHLTCLRAAAEISDARVEGDYLGSKEVVFIPGRVKSGEYRFAVGTAGSTSLVFQTIFMPLAMCAKPSLIYLEGGTHNGSAPSFDFIKNCFLSALQKMGYSADVNLERYGFYPAGGGAWSVNILPYQNIKPLVLSDRGRLLKRQATATSARLPTHVTEREIKRLKTLYRWHDDELEQRLVRSPGAGNIVSLYYEYENAIEQVDVVGEKGVGAEKVVDRAISLSESFLKNDFAVGEYLADQLLLPMVLGKGGRFITKRPSQHLLTNIDVINAIDGAEITISKVDKKRYEVVVNPI